MFFFCTRAMQLQCTTTLFFSTVGLLAYSLAPKPSPPQTCCQFTHSADCQIVDARECVCVCVWNCVPSYNLITLLNKHHRVRIWIFHWLNLFVRPSFLQCTVINCAVWLSLCFVMCTNELVARRLENSLEMMMHYDFWQLHYVHSFIRTPEQNYEHRPQKFCISAQSDCWPKLQFFYKNV